MEKIKKELYQKYFNIIREELNKVDAMELKPGKLCSLDEYNAEAKMILTKVSKNTNYKTLANDIKLIFEEMFAENFPKKIFINCAKNIIEKIKNI